MREFVGLLAPDGRVVAVNRASLDAAGAERRQVVGRPFWETPWWSGLPESQAQLRAAIREAAAGEAVSCELVHRGHGGARLVTVDFSLRPVRDHRRRIAWLVAEGRDISDRKRAEAELLRKSDELERAAGRLARLDQAKTAFFANVSHELRTPLTLVLGPVADLLAAGDLAPAARGALRVVERNARLLLKHVNDLLDATRLEAGQARLARATTDLAALVRADASSFDALAQERAIRYRVEAPGVLEASLDADKVERVVVNLLSNAFKFTPAGGTIRCTVRAAGERAVIEVADSGPGVAPAHRQAVFERFFQDAGAAPQRSGVGLGLGLAIARELTELHGGAIRVGDAPEGGALFTVELPVGDGLARPWPLPAQAGAGREVAPAALLELEALRSPAEAAPAAEVDPAGVPERPVVLVVEDNAEMRRLIADVLGRRFRVETAPDGCAGLARALELRPALILSDLMMPGIPGDELVRKARRSETLRDVPIVLLTARADDALRLRSLEEGAVEYLTKPFSGPELRARVANLVAMAQARRLLQEEVQDRDRDLASLAAQLVGRKREVVAALGAAQLERDRAERATRAKSDFLALVSHELLTPVTAAILGCERLQRDRASPLAPGHAAVLRRVEGVLGQLASTIRLLVDHSRIESVGLEVRREPVELADLAAEVVEEVRPLAERKGLTVRLAVESPRSVLLTDGQLLKIVIANLASNAVKFTDAGSVTVKVGRRDGACVLAVEDTGPGIPERERARLFEPFEPLEPIVNKHLPGMGLGLALARRLASALGARLEVESAPGVGSRFAVVLPEGTGAGAKDPDAERAASVH